MLIEPGISGHDQYEVIMINRNQSVYIADDRVLKKIEAEQKRFESKGFDISISSIILKRLKSAYGINNESTSKSA